MDLETEQLFQVTNVIGGAFRPSPAPSERTLAFEYYDANGSNVALMEIDREQWRPRGALPLPLEHRQSLAQALPVTPIDRPEPPTFDDEPPAAEDEEGRREKKRQLR